ncbi:nucleoside ABC transporter ATP-binding protein [Peptoclostridium litorale DSM 5388]|uniref:Sugar ABC transporter, ATP-binding protein n=1 Tax=Peptoclostridium litorale DSM 5388 TaxID=1121324 RepID=A0A069RD54_PEPLI|nr:ABC transporter ATP-binding protein [Peptoclostridium litorale]KDR94989.1 sugar ABC transporter, ATP-binding protein [Peptoclostridium litorale DSM 5388]SIN76970.1 nucleoside ABC transporter ATP-binding protein [Peptoclostridium litorale DSM 5388]
MPEKIIELKNVTKKFPGVLANDNISLDINKGEIFAVVGENGAGKSTLMKTMYGIHPPTEGEVYIRGKKIQSFSPKSAIENGIGMVHQHFMLVPSFTIAQNVVLGMEPLKDKVLVDQKDANEKVKSVSVQYGLEIDPTAKIEDMSVGVQQRVEILKTLYRGADILILDEPTAVLTPQETEDLFRVIRKLVDEMGKTVIIITHKLNEVLAISDRVAVMRQGKLIGVHQTSDMTEKSLAEMMVGREVLFEEIDREEVEGDVLIRVEDLKALDNRGFEGLRGISLEVRAGEILGVAGIEGNGQTELIETLSGMRDIKGGNVYMKDIRINGMSPRKIRDIGVAHIPEDRLVMGLSKDDSITENMLMGSQHSSEFSKKGVHLKMDKIREFASDLIKKFDVRTAGQDVSAGSLSGGNMQKVVIAREFSFNTPILLIAQPTRGVDIGAIEFIHEQIVKKRNEGCAILLLSAELDEIFRLSDRIITLYEGHITGNFKNGEINKKDIGYYMTGHRGQEGV